MIGVAVVGTGYIPTTEEARREVITQTEEVHVDALEARIKAAQDAARSEIEAKAQSAYESVLDAEMTQIADTVKAEYIAEIQGTITSEVY